MGLRTLVAKHPGYDDGTPLVCRATRIGNTTLSGLARDQGMRLGADGLKQDGQLLACASETDIFAQLGLGYREPWMRVYDENEG